MRTLILSTAMLVGAAVATPAMAQSVYIGPGGQSRDCRMVEKKVVKNNKTVVTKERQCDGDRRGYRDSGDRYVDRRGNGAGVYIGR